MRKPVNVILYRFDFQVVCSHLQFDPDVPDKQLLNGISQAVRVYYNYTGSAVCLNISRTSTGNLGIMGWFYQVEPFLITFTLKVQ